jgi:hypothetical protein
MFVRVNLKNSFNPAWNKVSYINLSNVLRMNVEKNQVDIYTIFRPKYSAHRIVFDSNEEAVRFAEASFRRKPIRAIVQKRIEQPNVDPLAIQAMADWEEEQKQMK